MEAVKKRTDLVTEVIGTVGRFRRQLRRSAGRGLDSARLTESQSELLWLVGRRPGISVRVAAAELGLVPNTASTLVSKLVAEGLLIRTVDETDRRACQLRLPSPPSRSSTRPARRGER
jgi:DNA-binding MarR family transcriptional regulator